LPGFAHRLNIKLRKLLDPPVHHYAPRPCRQMSSCRQAFDALNIPPNAMHCSTITLHTAQLPPFPTLFQPGPAFLFVTINGIPSNGTFVIVGNGQIGTQPMASTSVLPSSASSAQGSKSANDTSGGKENSAGPSLSTLRTRPSTHPPLPLRTPLPRRPK
jgi:Domain of unknown function (DUF1929)